jgi:hypothetical protein
MPAAVVTWLLYSSPGVAVLSLAAVVTTAVVVWGALTAVAVAVAAVLIHVLALDRGDADDR